MKTLINILKGIMKIPLYVFTTVCIFPPLLLLSILEDIGSGNWINNGFFIKLVRKLFDKMCTL